MTSVPDWIANMIWHGRCFGMLLLTLTALAVPECLADVEQDFALAATDYRNQNWSAAKGKFSEFRRRYPQDPRQSDALFFEAECAVQDGLRGEAVPLFQQFLQSYPNHAQYATAEFRLAESAYLQGDDARAAQSLEQFLQRYRSHVLGSYALPYLGDIAWNAGRLDQAERYYHQALTEFPDGRLAGKCLCQLGMLDFRAQRWQTASQRLRQFLDQFPQDPQHREAAYWYGRSELEMNNYEAAAEWLSNLASQPPPHTARVADGNDLEASIAYFAGRANRLAQRPSDAQYWYQQVLTQWPQSPRAEDAAYDEVLIAPANQARAAAEAFLKKFPNSPHVADIERHFADQALKQKQYAEAERLIKPLVQRAGLTPVPLDLYLLAAAQLGQSNYQGALSTLALHSGSWDTSLEPGVLLAKAGALTGLQRYAETIDTLNLFLTHYGDRPEANQVRQNIADATALLGNTRDAMRVAGQVPGNSSASPDRSSPQLAIAQDAYDQQAYQEAADAFRQLVESPGLTPRDRQAARLGLGLSLIQLSQWSDAIMVLEPLLDENPGKGMLVDTYRGLGRAHDGLNQEEQAARYYELMLQMDPRAPGADAAHMEIARWHESRKKSLLQENNRTEAQKEYLAAQKHLRQLRQDFPNSSETPAALYLWAWLEKDQKNDTEAIKLFGELAKNHTKSEYWDDAMYRLAEYYANAKQFERADELLQTVIADGSDPEIIPYAQYLRGQILAGLKRWSEIPEVLQPIIANPTVESLVLASRYWIAESHYRTDQLALAQQELTELALESRGSNASWVPMIPLRLAQIKAQPVDPPDQKNPEDWADALQLADSIAHDFPNFPQQFEVDYVRGRCLMMLSRLTEAAQAFQQAVSSPQAKDSETQAMADWMIAETLIKQEQYDKARLHCLEVERKYPQFPLWQAHALFDAGVACEKLGRTQDAGAYYQRVVTDFGQISNVLTAKAEDRLRAISGARSANRQDINRNNVRQ